MKSCSILFLNRVYPPTDGATGQLLAELAPELVRRGHRVTVVTSFNNYSFTDTTDFGAAGTITRSAPAATEANPASAPVP